MGFREELGEYSGLIVGGFKDLVYLNFLEEIRGVIIM